MRTMSDMPSMNIHSRHSRRPGVVGWFIDLVAREGDEAKHMRLIETLALGGKRQLQLVSCDGERYLIGVGGDSVQAILRVGGNGPDATERMIR